MATVTVNDTDVRELWAAYQADRSVENCNRLIEHYLYMVRQVVLRMSPMYNTTMRDYDDLVSNGVLGLIDAVQRYDPDRNIKFETYAPQRIRGTILDYMRAQDWIPTNTRKEIKRVRQKIDDLTVKLGYEPERKELAKHLGMTEEDLDRAMANEYQASIVHFENVMAGATYQASFQEPSEPIGIPDTATERLPEENYLENEGKAKLAQMIDELPEKERMVLDLYYRRELRLKDIAQILSVTESRVSQIHKRAIRLLSERYESEYSNG